VTKFRLLARAAAVTTRELRQDGLPRTARRAIRTARIFGLANALRRAEGAGGEWNWYRLELSRVEFRTLPTGMELRRCQAADIPLLAQLEPIAWRDAKRRLEGGGILWIVLGERGPMFACWTFRERSPVGQAKNGWLELPAGTAHLKDIRTAEAARGRGIAPSAVSMIARALAAEGFAYFVGRPENSNVASLRVYEKLGFVSMAPDDPVRVDFARQGA
jgi:ribosomal protein S18 acetylase RimI-like enzyme